MTAGLLAAPALALLATWLAHLRATDREGSTVTTTTKPGSFDPPDEPLDLPLTPYAGSSGHAGTDTSRDRADRDDTDGTTTRRQSQALAAVFATGADGMTWRELAALLDLHHGQASGVLSVLHKTGRIARLAEARKRCKVYVHPVWIDGRTTEPHGSNRATLAEAWDQGYAAAVYDALDVMKGSNNPVTPNPYAGGSDA